MRSTPFADNRQCQPDWVDPGSYEGSVPAASILWAAPWLCGQAFPSPFKQIIRKDGTHASEACACQLHVGTESGPLIKGALLMQSQFDPTVYWHVKFVCCQLLVAVLLGRQLSYGAGFNHIKCSVCSFSCSEIIFHTKVAWLMIYIVTRMTRMPHARDLQVTV